MKTLHLKLNGKWFKEIASGRKKEEYREYTIYWQTRLFNAWCVNKATTITFQLGYKPNAPRMVVEWLNYELGNNPSNEWGIKGERIYILKLGNIIKIENYEQ